MKKLFHLAATVALMALLTITASAYDSTGALCATKTYSLVIE